ncbi:MAG: TolC family protein [Flavipsychrobacter sp.]|nr:TolC family protein [Flavipsychrobacter sp.]
MTVLRIVTCITFVSCSLLNVYATDTLSLSIKEADRIFLDANLLLLAGQYNIDVQRAGVVQAKVYPNPVISADINVYAPASDEYFKIDRNGQKAFSVEQLIVLGGKRKTEIEIARKNAALAELELEELIRTLKYKLHYSLYVIKRQSIILNRYSEQLTLLDTIIENYEKQSRKGNIPSKEVVRLKSVYLKINNERSDILASYADEMAQLQLLLRTNKPIKPLIEESFIDLKGLPSVDELLSLAMQNRPDVKIQHISSGIARLGLKLEKRNAIPDITINGAYDQRGGAFNDQINSGLSMPLPVWNRNRGNIHAARAKVKIAEVEELQKSDEVMTEIRLAADMYLRSVQEYKKAVQYYNDDFEIVLKGVSDNFQKRNISLIEFVDFIESYNESVAELQRIKTQLNIAKERINYTVANEIF